MAIFVADEQPVPLDLERLRRLAAHVLADQRVPGSMELSILCVDADAVAQLNARHLGAKDPTDVLAFPMDLPGESLPGEPAILGDVVVCPEVAARQAQDQGSSLDAELDLLIVHGILHLLGHDHVEDHERRRMFDLTARLLSAFRAQEAPA